MKVKISLVLILVFLRLPIWADSFSYSLNGSKTYQPSGADILSACLEDRSRDLSCEKIIELNDFARDFIETLARRYNLKNYEREIGTVAGVLLYKKLTLKVFKDIDLTYNMDSEIWSLNYGTSF